MNGPTIWRLPCGSARRTENPSPRSRTRGTMTSSSASQDRLSPSTGSVEGIQLMAVLRAASIPRVSHSDVLVRTVAQSPFIPAQAEIQGPRPLALGPRFRGDERRLEHNPEQEPLAPRSKDP